MRRKVYFKTRESMIHNEQCRTCSQSFPPRNRVDLVPGRLLDEPTHHAGPGCVTRDSGHRVLARDAPATRFRDISTWAPGARPAGGTAVLQHRSHGSPHPNPPPPALRRDTGGSGPRARSWGAAGVWPSSGPAWAAPGLSRPRGAGSPCVLANTLASRIFINLFP